MTDKEDEEVILSSSKVKDVKRRRLLLLIGIVFLISLLSVGGGGLASYLALMTTAKDGTALAQQIKEECGKETYTSSDLAQFCPQAEDVVAAAPSDVRITPIPGPPGEAGLDGESGEIGATGTAGPAPTDEQVLVAVRSFCVSTKSCKGEDGSDATPAQVAIAVSSYCDNQGECRGPVGEPGTNGQNGTDGKNAPPITQDQIVQAVTSYCSGQNNCRGPAGSDGTDGADSTVPGPEGPPGIVGVVDNCGAAPDGQVLSDVTPSYDASTQTVTISCSYKDDFTGILNGNGDG